MINQMNAVVIQPKMKNKASPEKNRGLLSKNGLSRVFAPSTQKQAALQLQVLGQPKLTLEGKPIQIRSVKAKSLLYYLVVTGRPHSRQMLAGMFWGEMSEERARANLRVALVKLRRSLPRYIHATRTVITFEADDTVEVDSLRFEQCLRNGTVRDLETAVSLWSGPFFEDMHLSGAPQFEDWVRSYREYCCLQMEEALTQLIKINSRQQQYAKALSYTRQLLVMHPWCEEAHRHAMMLLALMGQRSAALAQYKLCRASLLRDLDVEPESFTEALYEQILKDRLAQAAIQNTYFY